MRVELGAYQFLDIEQIDLGEQYTDSGAAPLSAVVRLTTAMDEPFVNHHVTALLSEDAQRKIIEALQQNLQIEPQWERTRWWHAVGPDGELWAESSDEQEIRRRARPDDRVEVLEQDTKYRWVRP